MKILIILAMIFQTLSGLAATQSQLQALIEKRCLNCHDEDLNEGGVRFDLDTSSDYQLLEKAFLQVRGGDMPPPKKSKMSEVERSQMLLYLSHSLHEAHALTRKRLTKYEFINTLGDLLDIEIQPSWVAELPEDSGKGEFNTVGNLGFSEIHLQLYLKAIDKVVEKAFANTKSPSKQVLSKKFIYQAHRKRPKIITEGPSTVITGQPRTAKGLSFPYFRQGYKSEEDGYYQITYTAHSTRGATVMAFAGPYYQDGALVNKEPQTIDITEIQKKRTHTFLAYLKKGNELAFSTLTGMEFTIKNPVQIVGPVTKEWPPKRISSLFPGIKLKVEDHSFKVLTNEAHITLKKSIKTFAGKAFRKNVTDDSLKPYFELADNYLETTGSFLTAAKEVFKAILSSPNFLYHDLSLEDNFRFANRLSYFLWRSTPDNELRQAAYNEDFTQQVTRVLNSPKTNRFISDFTSQWLGLDKLRKVAPDFRLYPEFDTLLNQSMPKESIGFMTHILEQNLPLQNIIHSDFLYINNQLAKHYKVPNVKGPELRIVKNTSRERGGIISQAAVMMLTADGASTTPVKRGVWLSEHILGKTIPLPPKEVAGIEPDLKTNATIIEKLDAHRNNKACRSCHTRIDPYGVAFEAYDPIGQFRENYRILKKKAPGMIRYSKKGAFTKGARVETAYNMADGREYKNIDELKKILLADQEIFHRAFIQKLYTFALGRELSPSEILRSDKFSKKHLRSGLKTILQELIHTQLFRGEK